MHSWKTSMARGTSACLQPGPAVIACLAVAWALGAVFAGAQDAPADQPVARFLEGLLKSEDPEVRAKAAQALGRLGGSEAHAALDKGGYLDWPMWRYDAARSANTPLVLAEDLHLQWVRALPEPMPAWHHQWDNRGKLEFDLSYSPVVKGRLVFVPSNVTDSVTAYAIEDGAEVWRFHADGPVRLAPVAWEDWVYFVSDDGYLYCLAAATGELAWKFRGGPGEQRLLGNERIISFWAARGGPVIADGVLYFTAGIWPMHGVFIYALDARTGAVEWVNDSTSSAYVELPHGGASGYGSLAPQGYLAVGGEQLVVSGGRTLPATLDRKTGEVLQLLMRSAKGAGGYAVDAEGLGFARNAMLNARVEALAAEIDGEVYYSLAAHGRLLLTTKEGALYCFGPEKRNPIHHAYTPDALGPPSPQWSPVARELLTALGESEGYALLLGAGSGGLIEALLAQSNLHLAIVEADTQKVRALRDRLAGAGLYGRRAAVIEANPAHFLVQPYLFSIVASEDAAAVGIPPSKQAMAHVLDRLRPYGGVAYLGVPGGAPEAWAAAAEAATVDQVAAEARGNHLFARRGGPLTGAGEWTHQHRDASNTLMSGDDRVRLPLGILWFGGPSNHNILPRHSGGPRPQVVGGRIIHLGVENVGARCVYTGRQLWDRPYPGIGHPFTNLELERNWQAGLQVYMTNIPGATYIGSPVVSLPGSVYLRYQGQIHRLDAATGETEAVFAIPGTSVAELYGDEAVDWGHISVQGDFLITTAEPHLFEDQVLGWENSYSGTSSRRLVVMNRHTGEVLWQREARIGFRHNTIASTADRVFVIDGLSENARAHLARRGAVPEDGADMFALNPRDGAVIWSVDRDVFGTFLLYSKEHDLLIEGGSQDLRRTFEDEPRELIARRGATGEIVWESGGRFTLPGVVHGDMLIPGRPGTARSIITGDQWVRGQPHTGETAAWKYSRTYGCNTVSASQHMLFFRSGAAGFFDLQYDSGTGNFGGFRSGCTSNLVAADGVLAALDYTRTCTCNYQHQTSLALIHMPGDKNIELWTRHESSPPDPERHGINFGAPGRRVDDASGTVWFDAEGALGRHASAITDSGGSLAWVVSFGKEFDNAEEATHTIYDLLDAPYTVRLHFAELNKDAAPGDRVFDLLIGGEEVLRDFDIVAAAGGALRGVVREHTVHAAMTLEISLRKSDGAQLAPLLNGIELIAHGHEPALAK